MARQERGPKRDRRGGNAPRGHFRIADEENPGSRGRYEEEDDHDYRERRGRLGWYGDPEGQSEAAERRRGEARLHRGRIRREDDDDERRYSRPSRDDDYLLGQDEDDDRRDRGRVIAAAPARVTRRLPVSKLGLQARPEAARRTGRNRH